MKQALLTIEIDGKPEWIDRSMFVNAVLAAMKMAYPDVVVRILSAATPTETPS